MADTPRGSNRGHAHRDKTCDKAKSTSGIPVKVYLIGRLRFPVTWRMGLSAGASASTIVALTLLVGAGRRRRSDIDSITGIFNLVEHLKLCGTKMV